LYKLNQFDILHTSTYVEQCINATVFDIFYEDITSALLVAAASSVPSHKKCARICWWNQEMYELKDKAMSTHNVWLSLGKPRSGHIFAAHNQAKYNYC